jgi:hypothetical protein
MKRALLVPLLTGAAALAAIACSDGTSPATSKSVMRPVSLSFATVGSSLVPGARLAGGLGDVLVASDSDSLVITKVQLVFGRLELVRSDTAACRAGGDRAEFDRDRGDTTARRDSTEGRDSTDADSSRDDSAETARGDSVERERVECQEIKSGPVLVDVPVDSSVVTSLNVPIDTGLYRFLEGKVRPARASDTAFLAANPDFDGVSVRVEGTFNGTPFVYTGSAAAELELRFNPPLSVTDPLTNVTIHINLDKWFRDAAGGVIDPSTASAGGVNESLVARNIHRSFNVFCDRNRDGHDDDGNDANGNDDGGSGR